MNINGTLSIKFMQEKKNGCGEDSAPLFLIKEKSCAIGVFDGMGGAGAATCKSEYGEGHTKAYVASRIIKDEIYECLDKLLEHEGFSKEVLRNTILARFRKEQNTFPVINKSVLRTKLVREYPTTMALITIHQQEEDYNINSYWAGDSRNYLWTKEGFYQISKDDLDCDFDPLENISKDSPLSNCLCADREFHINQNTITIAEPFIVLSATDGCFGYFPTPMHFENVLVEELRKAHDCHEWEKNVKNKIQEVTGDDISLSLIAVGVKDFQTLQDTFTQREITGLNHINELTEKVYALEKELSSNRTELEATIHSSWNQYKTVYLKHLQTSSKTCSLETEDIVENSTQIDEPIIEKE